MDMEELGQLLLDLVHDISRIAGFGDAVKKDCTDLTRRISLLSHFLEEIKEFKGHPFSPSASSSSSSSSSALHDLLVVLNSAKRLLLDEAGRQTTFAFQRVTWHLERTLGGLPYDHFEISDEVQEQVELVRAQLRRATERYGPLNKNVLARALSQPVDKQVDLQESSNTGKLSHDNQGMVDTIPKPNGMTGTNTDRMGIHKLGSRKERFASSMTNKVNDADAVETGKLTSKNSEETKKPDPVLIPDDYRCPISLELMRDPVIISTGQTYERSCIQRWIDCGNRTCPKTQQQLCHLSLTPNYALRSLIMQWCEKHKIEQPMGSKNGRLRKGEGSFHEISGDMASITSLVNKLSSRSVEERRNAVTTIRSMSKKCTDNRILIAEAGAIPVLVNLLTSEDITTQENAVTSILNLSIYEHNKGLIMLAGAVSSIVQVLRMGSMEARENAAATLFSLSLLDENKITIGASGAIAALVKLLQNGSVRGKKDAATALFNLCIYQGNKGRAVRAGILIPLMKMLTNSSSSMVDEALTLLSVLSSHQECKAAIAKASAIPVLIDLMRTGLPRTKENAAAILLALCKKDAENLSCMGRLGAFIPLTELAKSGTDRAKRKATSLLELLRKLQQFEAKQGK